MKHIMSKLIKSAVALACAVMAGAPSYAEELLEQIIVTATRSSEKISDLATTSYYVSEE